jgi:RNA polymerase sigma factor (sigma-70 family)
MSGWTSDNELLRASQTGDKQALGAIVRRYQSLSCALTYSATGDVHRSEELAQETFLRAWRSLPQLGDVARFRAWLCAIARNLCAQWIRDRARAAVDAANFRQGAEPCSVSPDPGQAVIDKERQEVVWAAVRLIPKRYREPLVLFYRRQHSVSKVAADLGLSQELVRQRLHRGRQLIKAEVASLVEETLARSGPGKAFAVAVVAALPALVTPPASAAVFGIAAKAAPPAKTLVGTSLPGGILGPILGLPGGILGAWWSSKFNGSLRERRFMIRIAVAWWLLFFALDSFACGFSRRAWSCSSSSN